MPSIAVHAYDHGATTYAPLPDVWIYWKNGSNVTVLRADAAGVLKAADLTATTAEPYPTKDMPWVYTADFQANKGAVVEVAFTRGAKPIPATQLADDRYTQMVIGEPWPAPFKAPENTSAEECWIGIGAPNAIGWMFTLDILLPNHKSEMTVPGELTFWPLLRETVPQKSTYYTQGLPQGAAIWTGNTDFAGEDEPVAALPAANRPKEKGLHLAGSVETRVTGLDIVLLDSAGAPIARAVANLTATGTFTADFKLDRTEAALGPVQVVYQTKGAAPDYTDSYYLHLTGLQLGLVDDYQAEPNGAKPGPVPTEADDRMIVDFQVSPKTSLAALKAETRARRMVPYDTHLRRRPFSAAQPTEVEMPEMPLWMAELQFVGVSKTALRELLDFRKHLLPKNPDSLQLSYDLALNLLWDGPDAATEHPRCYSYAQAWELKEQKAILKIDKDLNVSATFDPAPKPIPFPLAGRRAPAVLFDKQKRKWGRHAGASEHESLVIEWQPKMVDDAGIEAVRGGDGMLSLDSLAIAAVDVLPPAVDDPVVLLPRFRVQGVNPIADLNTTIELAVKEYYNAHRGEPSVAALTLNTWIYTVKRILNHEAKKTQFGFLLEHFTSHEDKYCYKDPPKNDHPYGATQYYYGLEKHMPLFGPPHGYGMGQLDTPAVTDDGAWSFVGNIRGSVRLLMAEKANETYTLLSEHQEDTAHWRACYQRNVIKQYNSGRHEFKWSGSAWKINPNQAQTTKSGSANLELLYPNKVLNDQTAVVYWTGANETPVFNWPITFVEANYGELPD